MVPDKRLSQAAAMNTNFRNLALWAIIGLLVVALVMLFQQPSQRTAVRDITYSELLSQIEQGRVHDVTIAGNEVLGHLMIIASSQLTRRMKQISSRACKLKTFQ